MTKIVVKGQCDGRGDRAELLGYLYSEVNGRTTLDDTFNERVYRLEGLRCIEFSIEVEDDTNT